MSGRLELRIKFMGHDLVHIDRGYNNNSLTVDDIIGEILNGLKFDGRKSTISVFFNEDENGVVRSYSRKFNKIGDVSKLTVESIEKIIVDLG